MNEILLQQSCPSLDELPEIAFSQSLTGMQGTNRDVPLDCSIEASSDFEAVARWLNQPSLKTSILIETTRRANFVRADTWKRCVALRVSAGAS